VDVAAALERVHLGALRARVSLPRRPWLLDTARGSWAPWAQRLVPGDARFDAGPGQINDGVGSEHPAALAAAVRARPGCVGVALDGDGDRVVLVDETGRVVPGDALIGLLAARSGAHRLVVTTMSSRALEAALPGVEVHRVDVGDRNVRARMDATGAPLGGEESGHVLRADFPGGDGLLMGLWALQLLGRDPLCEAVRPFLPWPRRAGRIAATTRKDIADVAAFVAQAEAAGGALVRWSGTEPVLRWMVEGPDEAALEGVASTLERELCAWVS
jgi:phosphoglucosamine mutase